MHTSEKSTIQQHIGAAQPLFVSPHHSQPIILQHLAFTCLMSEWRKIFKPFSNNFFFLFSMLLLLFISLFVSSCLYELSHILPIVRGDKYDELLVNPVSTDTKTNTNYPICLWCGAAPLFARQIIFVQAFFSACFIAHWVSFFFSHSFWFFVCHISNVVREEQMSSSFFKRFFFSAVFLNHQP